MICFLTAVPLPRASTGVAEPRYRLRNARLRQNCLISLHCLASSLSSQRVTPCFHVPSFFEGRLSSQKCLPELLQSYTNSKKKKKKFLSLVCCFQMSSSVPFLEEMRGGKDCRGKRTTAEREDENTETNEMITKGEVEKRLKGNNRNKRPTTVTVPRSSVRRNVTTKQRCEDHGLRNLKQKPCTWKKIESNRSARHIFSSFPSSRGRCHRPNFGTLPKHAGGRKATPDSPPPQQVGKVIKRAPNQQTAQGAS